MAGTTVTGSDVARRLNRRVDREYTALARRYDRRWKHYLEVSLDLTERQRLPRPGERVLDVACGTGLLLERLGRRTPGSELHGVDRVAAMLERASVRVADRAALVRGDAGALPYRAGTFDLVYCTSALHYVADAGAAVGEFRRVLKPGGTVVVTDWCRDFAAQALLERVLRWTGRAHARTRTKAELTALLEAKGFAPAPVEVARAGVLWALMSTAARRR